MVRTLLFLAIAVGFGQTSSCYAGSKTIGNWTIETNEDPSSNKRTISAKISDNARGSLTIRCARPGGLDVSIDVASSKSYSRGETVRVDYGSDSDARAEQKAKAVGPTSVSVSDPRQILQDALAARTLRLQLQTPDGKTARLSFEPGGAGQALTQILLDCPEDLPASR